MLGEDLVLYKDKSGKYGLIQERCPHRGVSLVYGIPEEDGLRCQYHGWCFNGEGQCTEQPNEPKESTFKDRIKIAGYPVQEMGGLIFALHGTAACAAFASLRRICGEAMRFASSVKRCCRSTGCKLWKIRWTRFIRNGCTAITMRTCWTAKAAMQGTHSCGSMRKSPLINSSTGSSSAVS